MALFIAGLLFFALMGAISIFGYIHYVRPTRLLDQLVTGTSGSLPSPISERNSGLGSPIKRWVEEIGKVLPISAQDASTAKNELIAGGFRSQSAVSIYYGLKALSALFFIVPFFLFCFRFIHSPVLKVVTPLATAGLGYSLPAFILGRRVKSRREQIRLALPDVLDLLVVCSEAGCGLDHAIVKVSHDLREVHPAVADELSFVNMEVMAGKSRAEALRNFGVRTGEDEVKKLVAILIQTDRFGTSISEALRTQSEFLRVRRRQEAEERAGKVGVKLVFPIFFFCLPSLLVVTAGGGMLQIYRNLLPAIRNVHH